MIQWKKRLYLKIIDGLDDETALLVFLPELRIDRVENLIQKFSERSFLHQIAVLFLTENDKWKIAKVIEDFQKENNPDSEDEVDSIL